jgi:hypothetical protein
MGFSPQGDITRLRFNEIFNRDDWFGTPKN